MLQDMFDSWLDVTIQQPGGRNPPLTLPEEVQGLPGGVSVLSPRQPLIPQPHAEQEKWGPE